MMMKQDLIFQQKLTQTLQLSMSMKNSLDILKLNQEELLDYIEALVEKILLSHINHLRICILYCMKHCHKHVR